MIVHTQLYGCQHGLPQPLYLVIHKDWLGLLLLGFLELQTWEALLKKCHDLTVGHSVRIGQQVAAFG